ncbi:hypothetical protein SPSIL_028270 [Sporomusa silvacetica DSM 10669]|uniref:Uncharacterized protein n=1 Tax=Sporomusa silvacetica DSM 10669 TaxID=1123289 RepID=A0ABZ3IMJ8_9FIRM|nr:hypothetical protein [Sporomusa silvacetica]OZC21872.1 hypothetical protein SPSIL_07980 [Sporomusa silvacetica DSM 10669]
MVITFCWRRFLKRSKLYIKIILLTLIIFYILPALITILLECNNPGLKIRDQHLLEKPLRVMATSNLVDIYIMT